MRRRNRKRLVWESWNKVTAKSSPRVRNQELIRQIKKRAYTSNGHKTRGNLLAIEPYKPVTPKQESERSKEDSQEVINILNQRKKTEYFQSHSITNLSPRTFIDKIRFPKTKVKRQKKTQEEELIKKFSNLPIEEFINVKVSLFNSKRSPRRNKSVYSYKGLRQRLPYETSRHFPKFVAKRAVSARRAAKIY